MRKVILYIASSLDGFIAREDGRIDWLPQFGKSGEDYGFMELMSRIDTILIGRKTYEQMLTFKEWPYPGKKSYVFTGRNFEKDGNVEFNNNAVELVKKLKLENGKDIWLIGGAGLNGSLLKAGLVDEIILTVIPVIIGEGIQLFGGVDSDFNLELSDCKKFKSGLIQFKYDVL